MKRSFRRILKVAPAVLAWASLAAAAGAAVYIPTKTADTADGTCTAVDCSLREAVLAANANPGDDVILLHAGIYVLTIVGSEDLGAAGDLDLLDRITLLGDGAASTIIDGGGIDRILHVPGGITAEVRDVTLRNGRAPGAGGAIYNAGNLTVLRSILSGNASVAGSFGPGLGGAITSTAPNSSLSVADSILASNTAADSGGAMAIGGEVTLANVTITGNQSTADFGGGLYIFSDAVVTVNNATIAGNTALGGGGVFAVGNPFISLAPKISNSVIAGNTAGGGPDCSGDIDSDYNLIGNGIGCSGPSVANHDIVGTSASPIDAKLGPLAENGGPTPTRALLAGSPALDLGNPAAPGSGGGACEATDQRGATRPGGVRCDMGAFEATTECVSGGSTLCLQGGRFKVTANWQTVAGSGPAQGVKLTDESGYFYFFSPGNVEITVKILNACTLSPPRYWVFASGMTNVHVDLTVTDTQTGSVKTYTNPLNRTFRTILDTGAFSTCP